MKTINERKKTDIDTGIQMSKYLHHNSPALQGNNHPKRHHRLPPYIVVVRRAALMRSQQGPEMWWSVPFTCAWLYMSFFFILFDLCLFITILNFILNYVVIVTFGIFTYYKIWIMLIIYCFIWNYWIIYFVTCLEVFWSVMS